MTEQLVNTSIEGSVFVIRLCSRADRNALTTELREQLGDAIEYAQNNRAVRAVYLTGEGPTFCSGGNLNLLKNASAPWTVHRRFRGMSTWLTPLITLDKPVVIGVRGQAVGGGFGLALTGDLLIAGQGAKFIPGFFRIGVVPDIGTMYHLPRLIGMAAAKRLLYSGATLSAQDALELGLVAQVVPDEKVDEIGLAEATRLANGPAEVMGLAKNLMARSFETSLHDMLAFEGFGQILAMSSPEFQEGLGAALDGRPADFKRAASDQ
ncbi:enoyl-CoA hydratase/isomerase family protein [Burkholderia cepacia]|uniref:enoyl-CoA hydratase/isomerase family protein n=1 Tax=Burkholderia TaxID=32008 RepID=UPI000F5A05B1|nr:MULTISPECIES: enoyl-CoA hydratase/isomerase family protein [Burkholderia]MBE2966997.1 enoyl-CoA hydratase/isomerase family protein [Burkholderia cepacia]RQS40869.1 enoyl-CoA hydratase/isomerase family protein [Burkholderia sp. Bp8990]